MTDDEIHVMITTQVTREVRDAITEMFGSVKITMIELFDERYATVSEAVVTAATTTVAAVGFQGRWMM